MYAKSMPIGCGLPFQYWSPLLKPHSAKGIRLINAIKSGSMKFSTRRYVFMTKTRSFLTSGQDMKEGRDEMARMFCLCSFSVF
jgi:hypothetical protein